jgi:hypothetical protein
MLICVLFRVRRYSERSETFFGLLVYMTPRDGFGMIGILFVLGDCWLFGDPIWYRSVPCVIGVFRSYRLSFNIGNAIVAKHDCMTSSCMEIRRQYGYSHIFRAIEIQYVLTKP